MCVFNILLTVKEFAKLLVQHKFQSNLNQFPDNLLTPPMLYSVQSGEWMASGGGDSTVVVWHRSSTGSWEKEAMLNHAESVSSVAFSPDDAVLGTSSSDNNARIYEAGGSWDELARIKGHQDEANGLSFMSAGPRLTMGI